MSQASLVRVRVDLAYDGSGFSGWARQPGRRTVQDLVETALSTVLRLPGDPGVTVTCAGRTDAGVHARGQVLHADVPGTALAALTAAPDADWPSVLVRRLNRVLDPDVRVRTAAPAPAGFDARFAALWRRYRYRVCDRGSAADPLLRGHILDWRLPLDLDAMNSAAAALVGEHDFAAYCRARPGGSSVRDLQQLSWHREAAGSAVLDAQADGFCHHMVRSLAGALLAVGSGRKPVDWPGQVLQAGRQEGRRDPEVLVAPAHGLTLEEVCYPADDLLATRSARTRRRREGSR